MTALARLQIVARCRDATSLLARQSILGAPDRGSFAAESYRLRLIDSWDFLGFTTGIEAVSFRRHDSVGGQGS